MVDLELAQKIVDYMNDLLEIDRPAIASLIANRVPCNEEMGKHPTAQVMIQNDGYALGLLGLLNGLCGTYDSGWGAIAADFEYPKDQASVLKRFRILDEDRK